MSTEQTSRSTGAREVATIEMRNLTKRFDDLTAVDGVDLLVEDGEFLVLVGPSGCGKSTLLRMIAGLETITEGELSIADQVVNEMAPKNRGVAMVFQNYGLYPHMSAKRNMTFGAKSATSFNDEEIEERVTEAAGILDISDLLDRKPAALSGGEQQRVAMGRALIRDPSVFLLDEPLSNLDAKLRDQMRAELRRLHEELQTTTVYVTHDQTEAMTLGDRVAVMNQGRIQQVDPPQQLYDYPNNEFVASFIGSPRMNIFTAELRQEGDKAVAVDGDLRLPLGPIGPVKEHVGETFRVGVRPEDIHLESGTVSFPVTVRMTEALGDSLLVHGDSGDALIQFETEARQAINPGDVLDVTADTDRVHLFDLDSGETVYHSDRSAVEISSH